MLPINELIFKKVGDFINTIGVISEIDEIKEIHPRDKPMIKVKNFVIIDQSNVKVKVALWGQQAESFAYNIGDIVILSKVKVTDFGGMVLSVQWESIITKIESNWNDFSVANDLRSWWSDFKMSDVSKSLKRKLSFI